MKILLTTINMIFVLSLCLAAPAQACTLFAAAGAAVKGGGTLLAKNRDFVPSPQELRIVRSGKYAYLGLFSLGENGRWTLRAGVNEKGLAAVSAMASSLPKNLRLQKPRKTVLSYLLKNCANVDEALTCRERFYGAKFLMLSDGKQIAQVEIGLEGRHTKLQTNDGTLGHTNFYLSPEFEDLNLRVKESSECRYQRISQLLQQTPKPFGLYTFYNFSQDAVAGPDNSLWRTGSKEKASQTLASFIVKTTPDKKITILVKYRPLPENKGREEIQYFTNPF